MITQIFRIDPVTERILVYTKVDNACGENLCCIMFGGFSYNNHSDFDWLTKFQEAAHFTCHSLNSTF